MSHLHRAGNPHRGLLRRLEASTASLPEPRSSQAREGLRAILEILYSPEDAALAAQMPVLPSSLKTVARRTGLPEAALRPRLEAMCDRGLVMDLVSPRTGRTKYFLAPPVVGFFEFALMRVNPAIPQKRLAEAFHAYAHGDDTFAREVFGRETVIGRALAHETALGPTLESEVLDWERASALVREARTRAVSLCFCRHKAEHLGRACAAPREACLSLNAGADFVVRRRFGRSIDAAEALDVLAAAREARLVHIADNVQERPTYICNCCGCCCEQLQAIQLWGLAAVNPSGFQAQVDSARCSGCLLCQRACPIGAIESVPREGAPVQGKERTRSRVLEDRCLGCGVCVGACKRDAMHLLRRPEPTRVPLNAVEKAVRIAVERGRLADLVFDEGAGRGYRVLNRMLAALLKLPPASRALANEQLRSRFVRFALGRVRDPTA